MVENLKISISKGKKDENMYVRSLDIFFFSLSLQQQFTGKKNLRVSKIVSEQRSSTF